MTLEQQLLKYKYIDDMGNIINYTGFINYLVNEGAKLEHKLQSYSTEEGGIKDSSMRYNVDSIFNQLELIRQLQKCTCNIRPGLLEQIRQLQNCTHSIKATPVPSREHIEPETKRCFILNLLKRIKQKLH